MIRADQRLLAVRVDERRDLQKRRKKKPRAVNPAWRDSPPGNIPKPQPGV